MTTALIFPGQGSQAVGMLADVAPHFTQVRQSFERASDTLGFDLWKICQEDGEKLSQTIYTQTAMLTAGYAVYQLIKDKTKVACVSGHSLGEYTALVAAGCLAFEDALRLVYRRGDLMQQQQGAMLAVLGFDDNLLLQLCDQVAGVVEPANYNSKGQTVVSGTAVAIEQLTALLKQNGAKRVVPLNVSIPSHCSLMLPISDTFFGHLKQVPMQKGVIPVIHNVDASSNQSVSNIMLKLKKQLYSPVQWIDCMQVMNEKYEVQHFIECGYGKVLTQLGKRIIKQGKHQAIYTYESLREFYG